MADADERAFTLQLTATELKITHTALRSLLDDFGHDERDVSRLIRAVLAKLPDDAEIQAIDLSSELGGRRAAA
jgi:hypothetical protein